MTVRLLVCDLDNTLYDWVGYFVPAFYAMVDEVVKITGCDRERLLDDLRDVHRMHHDAEHPFALLETRTVRDLYPDKSRKQLADTLNSAFHVFNRTRQDTLQVYPGVRDGLDALKQVGVVLVAHTESKLYATLDRLSRLELTHYFRRIYCRERTQSEHPDPNSQLKWLSRFSMDKVVELSHHQRKPDERVLIEICRTENIATSQTAYVGDSVTRDVLLAKRARVSSIWAKYGTIHEDGFYDRLVRITHWTPDDVQRETKLQASAQEVRADFVLENRFDEILGPNCLGIKNGGRDHQH